MPRPPARYFMWVEWSDRDQTFRGLCPDLITGIHGDDPVRLDEALRALVAEVIRDTRAAGAPPARPGRSREYPRLGIASPVGGEILGDE